MLLHQINQISSGLHRNGTRTMLRINAKDTGPNSTAVHVEGKITGEWVDELRRECLFLMDCGRKVTLDLTCIDFVDYNGAELLRALASCGASIEKCSPFIHGLIAGGVPMRIGRNKFEQSREEEAI